MTKPDDEADLDLLLKKGVYPYDYMSRWNRFEETKLPAKKHFYSKLSESHIADEQYHHTHAADGTALCFFVPFFFFCSVRFGTDPSVDGMDPTTGSPSRDGSSDGS